MFVVLMLCCCRHSDVFAECVFQSVFFISVYICSVGVTVQRCLWFSCCVTATLQRCYNPAEISAVFDAGNTITAEQLTQMSPALLYQKLYAQCQISADTSVTRNSDSARQSACCVCV